MTHCGMTAVGQCYQDEPFPVTTMSDLIDLQFDPNAYRISQFHSEFNRVKLNFHCLYHVFRV